MRKLSKCAGCENSKKDPLDHTCLPASYRAVETKLRQPIAVELTVAELEIVVASMNTAIGKLSQDERTGALKKWDYIHPENRARIRLIKGVVQKIEGHYNSIFQ